MLAQIVFFLLDTVCGFLSFALLTRFVMQWARAPFRNPLGQFVVAVTDWMVRPVRRVIPGLFGLDVASLLLAWGWQAIYLALTLGLSGVFVAVSPTPTFAVALLAVLETLKILVYVGMGAVLISAIISWVNPHAPLADVVDTVSRPLLRPFRRVIPPVGGMDLSPLALLVVLQIALFVITGLRVELLPLLRG